MKEQALVIRFDEVEPYDWRSGTVANVVQRTTGEPPWSDVIEVVIDAPHIVHGRVVASVGTSAKAVIVQMAAQVLACPWATMQQRKAAEWWLHEAHATDRYYADQSAIAAALWRAAQDSDIESKVKEYLDPRAYEWLFRQTLKSTLGTPLAELKKELSKLAEDIQHEYLVSLVKQRVERALPVMSVNTDTAWIIFTPHSPGVAGPHLSEEGDWNMAFGGNLDNPPECVIHACRIAMFGPRVEVIKHFHNDPEYRVGAPVPDFGFFGEVR